MQDKSTIDFSQFPVGQNKNSGSDGSKGFFQTMSKKDRIYALIIAAALVLMIIFFTLIFNGREVNRAPALPEQVPSAAEGGI